MKINIQFKKKIINLYDLTEKFIKRFSNLISIVTNEFIINF